MPSIDTTSLCTLADMLLEKSVLYHDQEAVIFTEDKDGHVVVRAEYANLWCEIYDILDEELNGVE